MLGATYRMTKPQHRFAANKVMPHRRTTLHDDHKKAPTTPSPCTAQAGEPTAWIQDKDKIRSRPAHRMGLRHERAYASETRGKKAPPAGVKEVSPSGECHAAPCKGVGPMGTQGSMVSRCEVDGRCQ